MKITPIESIWENGESHTNKRMSWIHGVSGERINLVIMLNNVGLWNPATWDIQRSYTPPQRGEHASPLEKGKIKSSKQAWKIPGIHKDLHPTLRQMTRRDDFNELPGCQLWLFDPIGHEYSWSTNKKPSHPKTAVVFFGFSIGFRTLQQTFHNLWSTPHVLIHGWLTDASLLEGTAWDTKKQNVNPWRLTDLKKTFNDPKIPNSNGKLFLVFQNIVFQWRFCSEFLTRSSQSKHSVPPKQRWFNRSFWMRCTLEWKAANFIKDTGKPHGWTAAGFFKKTTMSSKAENNNSRYSSANMQDGFKLSELSMIHHFHFQHFAFRSWMMICCNQHLHDKLASCGPAPAFRPHCN